MLWRANRHRPAHRGFQGESGLALRQRKPDHHRPGSRTPTWQSAHLAPFATDPCTAVTVTLDSALVLTGFDFADLIGYLPLSADVTHTVEIFATGVPTPAISAEINLMRDMYYSAMQSAEQMAGRWTCLRL